MKSIVPAESNLPADRNPVMVFLATQTSEESRRTMAASLRILGDIIMPTVPIENIPWGQLRYQHMDDGSACLWTAIHPHPEGRPRDGCEAPTLRR